MCIIFFSLYVFLIFYRMRQIIAVIFSLSEQLWIFDLYQNIAFEKNILAWIILHGFFLTFQWLISCVIGSQWSEIETISTIDLTAGRRKIRSERMIMVKCVESLIQMMQEDQENRFTIEIWRTYWKSTVKPNWYWLFRQKTLVFCFFWSKRTFGQTWCASFWEVNWASI